MGIIVLFILVWWWQAPEVLSVWLGWLRWQAPRRMRWSGGERARAASACRGRRKPEWVKGEVPGCPWMNGRIERLFGTLKTKLDRLEVDGREALAGLMAEFRCWYNHMRPHQNLDGATPAEAWSGIDPYAAAPKQAIWFEGWGGLLTGYYLRR